MISPSRGDEELSAATESSRANFSSHCSRWLVAARDPGAAGHVGAFSLLRSASAAGSHQCGDHRDKAGAVGHQKVVRNRRV